METTLRFDKIKETFLLAAPNLLDRAMREGDGCGIVHFAILDNIRKWHAENDGHYSGCSPAWVARAEMMKEIRRTVAAWDIRAVGDLVALAPYAFPAWVVAGRYVAELEDSGWVLRRAA